MAPRSRVESYNLNLAHAVIVHSSENAAPLVERAAQLLRDRLYRLSKKHLPIRPGDRGAKHTIILAVYGAPVNGLIPPPGSAPPTDSTDAFTIYLELASGGAFRLWLAGATPRAVVYAVGWVLRHADSSNRGLRLSYRKPGLLIGTSPAFPIRGHQLGYRSLPNTYDRWDLIRYREYIEDLMIFGVNAIELTPTLDPEEARTEIMPAPPWEMNIALSALCAEYDLDVWLWLPVEDGTASSVQQRGQMVARRDRLFAALPRVDHLFVPGGDPGGLAPRALLELTKSVAEKLRMRHPGAGIWVSPQGFNRDELEQFYSYLTTPEPLWLTGVVYGPWIEDPMEAVRARTPIRYRLRRYPDITHTSRCQYPVPAWRPIYATTAEREPINPRPMAQSLIFAKYKDLADGAITYSEGVNDDVNKAVWSVLLWDPLAPVSGILLQYAYAYVGRIDSTITALIVSDLEANWEPYTHDAHVAFTYLCWNALYRIEDGSLRSNWRIQQGMFRAMCDAYTLLRAKDEGELEYNALSTLRKARRQDLPAAARKALKLLVPPAPNSKLRKLRRRIERVGELLWHSIGMQLSVEKHGADGAERGAVLDTIDRPLTERLWLLRELNAALELPSTTAQRDAIERIRDWDQPAKHGFYDDLGNVMREPHLVRGSYPDDPGFTASVQDEFCEAPAAWRRSWMRQATTLYDTPLQMRYRKLLKDRAYRLRVLYSGRYGAAMRLTANGTHIVHDAIAGTDPPSIVQFDLPASITKAGKLNLEWTRVTGRGCQVAEVWLEPVSRAYSKKRTRRQSGTIEELTLTVVGRTDE